MKRSVEAPHRLGNRKMATKAMTVCCFIVLLLGLISCRGSADETWQEVLTTAGTNVVFGASSTYIIWAHDMGIGYLFGFYFGLGYEGDPVRTDTAVTMGRNGDASYIYACTDGKLELVATNTSGTPQSAVVKIRYNSTDGYYRLQITEASPAVFVQFVYLSQGGILCTSGVPGSPISFQSSSSFSSNRRQGPALVYTPDMHVLRQVVDSAPA